MAIRSIGNTVVDVSVSTGPATLIALPSGTRPNDLLILTLLGSWGGVTDCTDPRMDLVYDVVHAVPGRMFEVWAGTAGDALDAVAINLAGLPAEQYGQFALANLVAYRDDFGGEIALDLSNMPTVDEPPPLHLITAPIVPAMDTDQRQAICVWAGHHDTIGGWVPPFFDASPWVRHGEASNGYLRAANYLNNTFPVDAHTNGLMPGEDTGTGWYAVAFAVAAGRQPIRLHPRDDGLGMSSATRLYPEPKLQRIVGEIP